MELRNSVYIMEFYYIGKYLKYFCVLNIKTLLLSFHYWIIADNKGAFSGCYRFYNTHHTVQNTHPIRAILMSWIMTCFSAITKSVITYHVTHRNTTAIDEAERTALKVWCKQNGAAPWCEATLNLSVKRWLKTQISTLIFLLLSCLRA